MSSKSVLPQLARALARWTPQALFSRRPPQGEAAQIAALLEALGGQSNLRVVDCCATRLRLTLQDNTRIDEENLRLLGAFGLVRGGSTQAQIVFGPRTAHLAAALRQMLPMTQPETLAEKKPHSPSPPASKE